MVEGPGCKLKGLKIKAKLKGKVVTEVRGNAVDKSKKRGMETVSPFHQLIGRELQDVQTLGKELFMYFGDLCLRVHFLMSGQAFINTEKVDNDPGGKTESAALELLMSGEQLTFKKSSVDVRESSPCRQKYDELNDLDICSPVFNFSRAAALIKEQQARLVCDVLLDQAILPGVGNIIKNEALFDSGIKPSSKISELNDDHISHLIKMTRDFTDIFYKCRRDGKPLYPYYKIYSKKKCGQCQGKVIICRLGDDNDRVTYFCENCQTNDLKIKQRKLPTKGSLLGWVKTGNEVQTPVQTDWSCEMCTLINKPTSLSCAVCLQPKNSQRVDHSSVSDPDCLILEDDCKSTSSVSRKRPLSDRNEINQLSKVRKLSSDDAMVNCLVSVPKANSGNTVMVKRTILHTPNQGLINSNTVSSKNLPSVAFSSDLCSDAVSRKGSAIVNPQRSVLNRNTNRSGPPISQSTATRQRPHVNSQSESKHSTASQSPATRGKTHANGQLQSNSESGAISKIPVCSSHKRKCRLKEVRKEGNNLGRWFFSCVVRNCNFFEWADVKFPLCPDHGKPCTIRTVMKIGPNNGRKFFACKMPRNKQCKFFEWAIGFDD